MEKEVRVYPIWTSPFLAATRFAPITQKRIQKAKTQKERDREWGSKNFLILIAHAYNVKEYIWIPHLRLRSRVPKMPVPLFLCNLSRRIIQKTEIFCAIGWRYIQERRYKYFFDVEDLISLIWWGKGERGKCFSWYSESHKMISSSYYLLQPS